jgi:hypothetical protein
MDILKELKGHEVTFNYKDNTATLNKYRYKYINTKHPFNIKLDTKCIDALIVLNILEEDSGNTETMESHFYLNIDNLNKNKTLVNIEPLIPILREIRINKVI